MWARCFFEIKEVLALIEVGGDHFVVACLESLDSRKSPARLPDTE